MLQLIFFDAYIAVNCYKVMYELLSYYQNKSIDTTDIINCIDNKTKQLNERYSNTLIQIWHYYLLNKFEKRKNIATYYFDLLKQTQDQNESINPLVLLSFIEKGDNKNKDIFKYIVEEHKKSCKNDKNWKQTIMLSKWWLPLLHIRSVDNHNYQDFYNSPNFLSIWKDLSNVTKINVIYNEQVIKTFSII